MAKVLENPCGTFIKHTAILHEEGGAQGLKSPEANGEKENMCLFGDLFREHSPKAGVGLLDGRLTLEESQLTPTQKSQ